MKTKQVAVIGGGAGGFFSAINIAEKNPGYKVVIYEKSKQLLGKVKVSGGGRCNVTNACFEPKELVKFYPRGGKELLGPFHRFMTGDMMAWLDEKGVSLKIEEDNRVFPDSDSSQTIIDCFNRVAKEKGIDVKLGTGIRGLERIEEGWKVVFENEEKIVDTVVIASGSNKQVWDMLNQLGHTIVNPVPSLFTFNSEDKRIKDLPGVVAPMVKVKVNGTKLEELGPLLITHWGLSGPAILKLSSVGARLLFEKNYQFSISVDWVFNFDDEDIRTTFSEMKLNASKQNVHKHALFELPKRLWVSFLNYCEIPNEKVWADVSKKEMNRLLETLKRSQIDIKGKNTNKDEFVTSGGVDLKEIDFKKFESKLFPELYIVGECLNIDALTGGFNFQAVWTGSYIISESL